MTCSNELAIRFKRIERIEFTEGLILLVFGLIGAIFFLAHYAMIFFGIRTGPLTVFSAAGLLSIAAAIAASKAYRKWLICKPL